MTALADRGHGTAGQSVGAARNMRARRRYLSHANLKGLAFVLLATFLLELFVRAEIIPEYLPPPSSIGDALWTGLFQSRDIAREIPATLGVYLQGVALAAVLGVALGTAKGLLPRFDAATQLTIEFFRPLPAVALIPLLILILGLGAEMRIAVVTYAATWPILFNTYYGVRGVDRLALDTARTLGVSKAATVRRVVFPSALPSIATGLRVSATIALSVAVVSELVAGTSGVGHFIANAGQNGQIPEVYAGIVLMGAFGYLINAALVTVEKRFVFWSPSVRDRKST